MADEQRENDAMHDGANANASVGVHIEFTRTRVVNDELRLVGLLGIPGQAGPRPLNIEMHASIDTPSGSRTEAIPLDASTRERIGAQDMIALCGFRYRIELDNPSTITFIAVVDGVAQNVDVTCRPFSTNFSEALNDVVWHRHRKIELVRTLGCMCVSKPSASSRALERSRRNAQQGKQTRALRLLISRLSGSALGRREPIWLYLDANGKTDNAWLQFLHDARIDDGVKRCYIAHGIDVDMPAETGFANAEIVPFGSRKHKLMHYLADKRLCSDISREVISPWNDDETWSWYCDLDNAEQIYLQHGVLWAHMPEYYSYEVTGIDREVVSTQFEVDNLTNNYGFQPDDLIASGMPRYDTIPNDAKPAKKILLCPSWRGYLAGKIVEHGREPLDEAFTSSHYFLNLVEFLTSENLARLLDEHGYALDFKLHPNFACYRRHFAALDGPFTLVDEVVESEYAIALTDYSSYSFDFVYLKRALVYFIPDEQEFNSGYNHYNTFDIPLDRAFGELVYDPQAAVDAIGRILENGGKPLPQHAARQDGLFLHYDSCQRARLYEAISD